VQAEERFKREGGVVEIPDISIDHDFDVSVSSSKFLS
jgi:hypothetical protein